jgi:hypothetical protein
MPSGYCIAQLLIVVRLLLDIIDQGEVFAFKLRHFETPADHTQHATCLLASTHWSCLQVTNNECKVFALELRLLLKCHLTILSIIKPVCLPQHAGLHTHPPFRVNTPRIAHSFIHSITH